MFSVNNKGTRTTPGMKNAFYFAYMTSQRGKQTIKIHILPNISRSKDNQTMKFDQLIKCNMRNIALEKSCTKCGEDVGQYEYCSCLLTRFWRYEFWNQPYLFNQAVFSTWPKVQDKKLNVLRMKKGEIKSIICHF